MKAILPVAGAGSRLRPLTNTDPKTLVQVAGKPILGHILDRLTPVGVTEIVLIVGQWGDRIVEYVERAYPGLRVTAVEQTEPKGLGHAIYTGRSAFAPEEPMLIVLGDTIFQADLKTALEPGVSAIGVRRVPNPSDFGVVELAGERVRRLIEKPAEPPTDLAIVGIYYVRQSGLLFDGLEAIIREDVKVRGEYQLTDGLQRMIEGGEPLTTFPVENWWDCGNPEILLETNRELLDLERGQDGDVGGISHSARETNDGNIFIPPVAIDADARIERSVIGPYVSVGKDVVMRDCIVRDTIVNDSVQLSDALIERSLIGENSVVQGRFMRFNVGAHAAIHTGAPAETEGAD